MKGHTDITTPRGFINLDWMLVAKDGTTPAACASSSWFVSPALTSAKLPCSSGSGTMPGLEPGVYDFSVFVENTYTNTRQGTGSVAGAMVTAGMITDVPVTIVLQQ